ncbi:hypothetical protein AKJ45_00245 [candidate division MSBL1 archaeon SCGC-AAA261F19]|uniref:Uncharacterized protein n=1 Tax=candidate division MSBL1 archaeon SCGC-AAA261F19 TaxID=1698275 RepID=A0A133VBK9_9EURY|nr:hypothetical protein AKJ45_00245 [candidate division MSBL1 archaeon SCGC-AAA261F19]
MPVIVSQNTGAKDLVKGGINGFAYKEAESNREKYNTSMTILLKLKEWKKMRESKPRNIHGADAGVN